MKFMSKRKWEKSNPSRRETRLGTLLEHMFQFPFLQKGCSGLCHGVNLSAVNGQGDWENTFENMHLIWTTRVVYVYQGLLGSVHAAVRLLHWLWYRCGFTCYVPLSVCWFHVKPSLGDSCAASHELSMSHCCSPSWDSWLEKEGEIRL